MNPTQEEIDDLHARYIKELTDLFNENKKKYAHDERLELELQ